MNFKFYKNKLIAGIINGFLTSVFILILAVIFGKPLQLVHLDFADSLYTKINPSEDIVIIAIDDKSVAPAPAGLGRYLQWSRDRYGRMLEQIAPAEPKVVAFDIIFGTPAQIYQINKVQEFQKELADLENLSEKDMLIKYESFINETADPLNSPDDNYFAEQISNLGTLVLAGNISEDGKKSFPLSKFSQDSTIGIINSVEDLDGVMRKIPTSVSSNNEIYENFSVQIAKKALGVENISDLGIPTDNNGNMLINFFSEPFGSPEENLSFKVFSFVDVYNRIIPVEEFRNKIILVGVTSAKEANDLFPTPKNGVNQESNLRQRMAGVEIHANTVQTILEKDFLVNQSRFSLILAILLISISLCLALNYLNVTFSVILAFGSLIIYWLSAKIAYKNGFILNMIYPFIAIILSYLAAWAYKYFIANKSHREITKAFSYYVSKKLVDQISKNPDMVKLGGEKRDVTVFFSDIKNSTTWSEQVEITSWVSQVSEYFTEMEGIMKKYDGTVDKYEGDAMMGFWNAPIQQQDHVFRGYLAALEMRSVLAKLHQKWQSEGKPLIEFRIGMNTGEAIVGNFGSATRFDYTVMGDTVNVASRLESSANKAYETHICVSGFQNHLSPEQASKFIFRELDNVILPGKNEPIQLFELLCLSQNLTPEIQSTLLNYKNGLQEYRSHNFQSASEHFNKNQNDPPSKIMLARCQTILSGQQISNLDQNMVYHIANK